MTTRLPHHGNRVFLTDGGLETDLIFHHAVELPHFAAFPLLDTADGRAVLHRYFDDYVAIARASGFPLMLESPTWRANPGWGRLLGYEEADLRRVNIAAIAMLRTLRNRHLQDIDEIVVSGSVGPRDDGYSVEARLDPGEAAEYHRAQLEAFAAAGADLATAYTITHVGEAVGIVRAARTVGLPIAVSFTVETDGRLPSGTPLGQAIRSVDEAAAPDYFLVNCAHPSHIRLALHDGEPWTRRIAGTRANASTRSHAELDEATQLDDGDPIEFAAAQAELAAHLPGLRIAGGCCGTDARHVAALAGLGGPASAA